jgi:hypothetical protein
MGWHERHALGSSQGSRGTSRPETLNLEAWIIMLRDNFRSPPTTLSHSHTNQHQRNSVPLPPPPPPLCVCVCVGCVCLLWRVSASSRLATRHVVGTHTHLDNNTLHLLVGTIKCPRSRVLLCKNYGFLPPPRLQQRLYRPFPPTVTCIFPSWRAGLSVRAPCARFNLFNTYPPYCRVLWCTQSSATRQHNWFCTKTFFRHRECVRTAPDANMVLGCFSLCFGHSLRVPAVGRGLVFGVFAFR